MVGRTLKKVTVNGKVNYGQYKYAFQKFVSLTVEGFTFEPKYYSKKGMPLKYELSYTDKKAKWTDIEGYENAKTEWEKLFPYKSTVESSANGRFTWEYEKVEDETTEKVEESKVVEFKVEKVAKPESKKERLTVASLNAKVDNYMASTDAKLDDLTSKLDKLLAAVCK